MQCYQTYTGKRTTNKGVTEGVVQRGRGTGTKKRIKGYFYGNYSVNNYNLNQNLVVLKYGFPNECHCLMTEYGSKSFDRMGNCGDEKFKQTLNK